MNASLLLALQLTSPEANARDIPQAEYTVQVGEVVAYHVGDQIGDQTIGVETKRVWEAVAHPECMEVRDVRYDPETGENIEIGKVVIVNNVEGQPRSCSSDETRTALISNPNSSDLIRSGVDVNQDPARVRPDSPRLKTRTLPWFESNGKPIYGTSTELKGMLQNACTNLKIPSDSCEAWAVQKTPDWSRECKRVGMFEFTTAGGDSCSSERGDVLPPREKFMIMGTDGKLREPRSGEEALLIAWHYKVEW